MFERKRSVWMALAHLSLGLTAVLTVIHALITGQWHHLHGIVFAGVDTTTYLPDMKIVYGAIQEQVSTLPAVMNLFGDGSKFGKPINNVGVRGYVFLARVTPNWGMGFRPEGTTGVGAALNQGFTNATVTLRYFYVPITITGQAENLSKGESRAFMQAKALEAKFDMKDAVSHVNVLVIGAEPGGQLAQITAAGAGNPFTVSTVGLLPGAIYLRVGQYVDCIPVGGGAPTFLGQKITAINYATNSVTVAGLAGANGQAIALGNPGGGQGEYPQVAVVNDGWFTCNGFQNLVNSSGVVQGIDPGVFPAWQSYLFDNGNAALSSQLLQQLRQFVKNRGGVDGNIFIVPSAQINQYVGIATTTLRFDITNEGPAAKVGKKALDLGFNVFDYAGLPMVEDKDARTDRIYHGDSEMMKKFEAIPLSLAEDEAGTWTRIIGANGIADAVAGLLRWYVNVGIVQRSAWGRLQDLLVPANFQTAPPTI
jgi:hypothetical protein